MAAFLWGVLQMICAYCQVESDSLQRDHVVPRSRGGPDDAFNIVMACEACNSAKRDSLPSEWLGDRCTQSVLLIEARVNAKLKAVFSKRDYKASNKSGVPVEVERKLFAYNVNDEGGAEFIGEIISELNGTIRMEAIDAMMATGCGLWSLSGNIKDVPRDKCELFNDRESCLESALRRNQRIYWKRDR